MKYLLFLHKEIQYCNNCEILTLSTSIRKTIKYLYTTSRNITETGKYVLRGYSMKYLQKKEILNCLNWKKTYTLLTNTRQIVKYSSTHTETQWSKRCTEPNPAWIYIEVMQFKRIELLWNHWVVRKRKKKNPIEYIPFNLRETIKIVLEK